jgi:hypothetical protein
MSSRPADPDFSRHPDAQRFRSALLRARSGVNFAGKYVLVSRSCGRMCREFAIMDAQSGKVFPGLTDAPPFEYRPDSRLIVFEPPEPAPGRIPCAGCSAAYYVWANDALELIPPETWVGSAPPPPGVRGVIDTLRAEEAVRVQAGPLVLRPTWDRLVISARDGTRQVLSDRLSDGVIERVHVYRGHIAVIDQHVVQVILPEGNAYILVDAATGVATEIDAVPVPSPDGSRFATASLDLIAGHDPNRFRIYRISPNGPVIEWSVEPKEWGPADPVWIDDSRIRFDRVTADRRTAPISFRRSAAVLEGGADGWSIVPSD